MIFAAINAALAEASIALSRINVLAIEKEENSLMPSISSRYLVKSSPKFLSRRAISNPVSIVSSSVSSIVKNIAGLYEAEDYVEADLIFRNNILCKGKWDFSGTGEGDCDKIEILGERGKISFSTFGFVPVRLSNSDGIKEFDFPKPDHVQYYLIEKVAAALLGKGNSPSTGESAARTSKIMDQIVQEYYQR